MTIRVDRAVIHGPWMNRMYTLIAADDGLYVLHTGPAVRVGFRARGALAQLAADKVVDRGLRKILAAEEAISSSDPEPAMGGSRHSRFVPHGELKEVDFRAKGSIFAGGSPILRVCTASEKMKFVFKYHELTEVQGLADWLAALVHG